MDESVVKELWLELGSLKSKEKRYHQMINAMAELDANDLEAVGYEIEDYELEDINRYARALPELIKDWRRLKERYECNEEHD